MLENLELIGTGFAVVMAVLACLWGLTSAVGRIFKVVESARQKTVAAPAPPAPAPAAPTPAETATVPAHHLVAISAAVAHMLGDGARITQIVAPAHQVADWPQEGRIQTFSGNRIRVVWGPTYPSISRPPR
ncbi:MAG: OadG family transporter subunit [Rhodospirillaceae bacterium]